MAPGTMVHDTLAFNVQRRQARQHCGRRGPVQLTANLVSLNGATTSTGGYAGTVSGVPDPACAYDVPMPFGLRGISKKTRLAARCSRRFERHFGHPSPDQRRRCPAVTLSRAPETHRSTSWLFRLFS